jgi:small subunit ribosomal protein S9
LPEANPTITSTGRRKTAVARVRMKLGTGTFSVNGRPIEEYFVRETLQLMIREVLETSNSIGRFEISAKVNGGGPEGQAGAVRHGVARALEKFDPTLRPNLKRGGFLTRDARKKERKKYGQRGARARFQFSKR